MAFDSSEPPPAQAGPEQAGDAGRRSGETRLTIGLHDVRKTFGRFAALNGVSLDVRPGELLALLGRSGGDRR